MIHTFLFETRLGEWLLTLLERWAGLAIVKADWLGDQVSKSPADGGEPRPGQWTQKGVSMSEQILSQTQEPDKLDRALNAGYSFHIVSTLIAGMVKVETHFHGECVLSSHGKPALAILDRAVDMAMKVHESGLEWAEIDYTFFDELEG